MKQQRYTYEIWQLIKLRMLSFLFLIALILPYFKYHQYYQSITQINNFINKINDGPNQQVRQINFNQFLVFLQKHTYQGIWESTIKSSKRLNTQNGTIQLSSAYKSSNLISDGFFITIKIFNGLYRDQGNYQIVLDSFSIQTQQQFFQNLLVFQTTSPMIGLSKHQNIFITSIQKPLYISKLKFRIKLQEDILKIQLLFAAQSQINVITKQLSRNTYLTHQIIFSILILIQIILQIFGISLLLLQLQQQPTLSQYISPTFIKLGISFDIAEIYSLCYLIYFYNMTILVFPTYFLLILVLYLQPYLLKKISPPQNQQHTDPQNQIIQNQIIRNNQQHINNSVQQDNLLNNQIIKFTSKLYQKNRNYIICICSFFVFYFNNMQNYIYFIYFFILILPQIIKNCQISNKVNHSIQSIFLFAYPRLIPILYTRFFGKNSLFMLQPCYLFCFVLIIFSLSSSSLLFIQKKYGSQSILPKFLKLNKISKKFKFFIIQEQNKTCSLCHCQISSLPNHIKCIQNRQIKKQVIYNKVILTPCHHSFHASCLQKWMECKVQCPVCQWNLPPLQNNL